MYSIENCIWCGNTFLKTRSDTRCCNVKCASAFSNYKKSRSLTKEEIDNFDHTKKVVLKHNRKIDHTNSIYDSYYLRKRYRFNNSFLFRLREFIDKIKEQKYLACEADIFQLINLYDEIFPNIPITQHKDRELMFSALFLELFEFYKDWSKKTTL